MPEKEETIINDRRENYLYYLWFPWQFLVMLVEELPDVGMVSAISPSCDWLIILGKKRKP